VTKNRQGERGGRGGTVGRLADRWTSEWIHSAYLMVDTGLSIDDTTSVGGNPRRSTTPQTFNEQWNASPAPNEMGGRDNRDLRSSSLISEIPAEFTDPHLAVIIAPASVSK